MACGDEGQFFQIVVRQYNAVTEGQFDSNKNDFEHIICLNFAQWFNTTGHGKWHGDNHSVMLQVCLNVSHLVERSMASSNSQW